MAAEPGLATNAIDEECIDALKPPDDIKERSRLAWSTSQTFELGRDLEPTLLTIDVEILDEISWPSVAKAVVALNSGSLVVRNGVCALHSFSQDAYYLLWREDKEADADELIDKLKNSVPTINYLEGRERPLEKWNSASSAWSSSQSYEFGSELEATAFKAEVQFLDKSSWTSVSQTISALNREKLCVRTGLCILYSTATNAYWLLWRRDRATEADEIKKKWRKKETQSPVLECVQAAPFSSKGHAAWSPSQSRELGSKLSADALRKEVRILDKASWSSVAKTISALNNGVLEVSTGLCILYSISTDAYWLVWRKDMAIEADKIIKDSRKSSLPISDENTAWSLVRASELSCDFHPRSCEHDQFRLLGSEPWTSVSDVISSLNDGILEVSDGLCILASKFTNTCWLLWRRDRALEAQRIMMHCRRSMPVLVTTIKCP